MAVAAPFEKVTILMPMGENNRYDLVAGKEWKIYKN